MLDRVGLRIWLDRATDLLPNDALHARLLAACLKLERAGDLETTLRDLVEWPPEIHLVQATRDGALLALQIRMFPDANWKYDLEKIRETVRD